ncbi:hypothetical protein ES703_64967 [subsurface metagenome]
MRGIAWMPTRIEIGFYGYIRKPYISRSFCLRPFGDLIVGVGFCFGEVILFLSEAWPFIRKE